MSLQKTIQISDKYENLYKSNTRYFILTGGRGSGKSFGVNLFCTHLTYEQGHRILFTRYTMTSAHLSIIPEYQQKIELLNASSHFDINKNEIKNNLTNSDVVFRGIKTSSGDQTANLKSLQGVTTWVIDEAEEMKDENIFDTIDLSIRQNNIQNRVILILNPTTKENWIYKRFFELCGVPSNFCGIKDDVTYIHTTYLDNVKNLSESFLKRVESMRIETPLKYKHKILGSWLDKSDGVVFDNWEIGEFVNTGQIIFGQDYGYYPDPTTLVKVSIDKKLKYIYLHECLYETNLSTEQIANKNRQYCGNNLIIGDSAEPRLLNDLRKRGVNILPCVKGAGSISSGINLMKEYKLIVTSESLNIIKELNNYTYSDKKSQLVIDDYNHSIDAGRYAISHLLRNPNKVGLRQIN